MGVGLFGAILPGFAIARRLDAEGDTTRHLLLAPAFGLLTLLGLSGLAFFLGLSLTSLTALIVTANLVALAAIRTELNPIPKTIHIDRSPWFWIFTLIAVYLSLIPLSYFTPMGVDWIGFSVLADSFAKTGGFNNLSPSSGYWIYPPAFPVLAAWLGEPIHISVFTLGVFCFTALLLGVAAVGEKMGCGHWTILAMLLAPALFAKNLDSGFPTVASQLGLIIVLVMFDEKLRWGVIAATSLVVAMIHPTGLIYLSTLIFAKMIVSKSERISLAEKIQSRILIVSIIFIVIIISPSFDGKAIFAEYGWQGGMPMVFYSGLLSPLAIWSAWTLRMDMRARIIILWALTNWLITIIHLFEGFIGFSLLSMLSYIMYSMSMHAFHIPLAILVGLRLSKVEAGTASDVGRAVMIAALLVSGVAHSSLAELSEHSELHILSKGDIALTEVIDQLPAGSVIYTENEHWGHLYDLPDDVGITAIPTLGILKQDSSIQNAATSAIRYDNIERIKELGITHALVSPKGVMMQYLQASTHWSKIYESGGSKIYVLEDDNMVSTFIPVIGDNMRMDPWASFRNIDPYNLGDTKHFIFEGKHGFPVNDTNAYMTCIMTEFVGDVTAKINGNEYSGSGWHNSCIFAGDGGFDISIESDYEYWINPLGASGRGDALIDTTGIRIHWIEVIYLDL